MQELFKTLGPIGLIAGVAMAVGAVLCHIFAIQLSASREELRKLRVALERDPSPGQLGEALKMWPEAAKYAQGQKVQELVKQAHIEEGKRAHRNESVKGAVRVLFFISAMGFALFIASIFLGREPAPEAAPKPEQPLTTTG
ncbi:MAG: hypothetical protein ABL949_01325 [Fimbriimonadaceae bacterium]